MPHETMKAQLAILILFSLVSEACAEGTAPGYAIRAGKIVTMRSVRGNEGVAEVINHGVVLISDGRIEAIGSATEVDVPQGYTVIDASDRWVMPGIVEAHSHIGTEGGWNDMVVPLNPELWIGDGIDPESLDVKNALAGGVTTIHTMPGSGTNLAGFTVIIKLHGATPEEMIVKEIGAMKISNAFNPERRGGDLGRTRMGMAWMLGYILDRGKAYADAWRRYEQGQTAEAPRHEPQWEMMREAFQGKIPVIVHTCRAWGVMQAIRMFGDGYGMTVIPTHTPWGGHLVGNEASKRDNVHVNIGPRLVSMQYGDEFDRRVRGMLGLMRWML
jgi:imidazolonepropionase-like amidohydrolase